MCVQSSTTPVCCVYEISAATVFAPQETLHLRIVNRCHFSSNRRRLHIVNAKNSKKQGADLSELELSDPSFEEQLATLKSSAQEKKKILQEQKYGVVDYDTPKNNSLFAKIGAAVLGLGVLVSFTIGDILPQASTDLGSEAPVEKKKLTEEEEQKFKTQLSKFEEVLKTSPDDATALEGASVCYAELGEYKKAEEGLQKLVQVTPGNAEAFRLLGEVKTGLKDYGGSVDAYRKAIEVSGKESMTYLIGLVQALLDSNQPAQAADEVLRVKKKLSEPPVAKESSSSTTKEASSTESDENSLDPVQLDLLLGKSYIAMKRPNDAFAVYNALIENHPRDFRGYLAKGVLFKEQGQIKEAERMLIKARFIAPPNGKALVDQYRPR